MKIVKNNDEISSIVGYLESNFGLQVIKQWFNPPLNVVWTNLSAKEFVTKSLGLEFVYYNRYYKSENSHKNVHFFSFVHQYLDM